MPRDAHGLDDDSLRGSESVVFQAIPASADQRLEPLSEQEKAAYDRLGRTTLPVIQQFNMAERLPTTVGSAQAGHQAPPDEITGREVLADVTKPPGDSDPMGGSGHTPEGKDIDREVDVNWQERARREGWAPVGPQTTPVPNPAPDVIERGPLPADRNPVPDDVRSGSWGTDNPSSDRITYDRASVDDEGNIHDPR
jgi:hypothetical protein